MKPTPVLIGCAVSVVLVAAYFIGRASAPSSPAATPPVQAVGTTVAPAVHTPAPKPAPKPVVANKDAPLPPLGTPLKDSFAELQARANAGDAPAATRLVRDLDRCSRLHTSEWKNAHAMDDLLNRRTEGMKPEQLRTYQALLDAMQIRQQGVQKNQQECAGVDTDMLNSLVPNMRQAAQLGDDDARACWLGSGPLYDARSLLDHPEALQSYRDSAPTMIEAGLAAGDWRTVDLLRSAYEPGAQSLLAGVVGSDAFQYYRYLKLYRLGAEPFRAARLDQQLASAAASLTPAQVSEADEWAQTTLEKNFRGASTGAAPEGWSACVFPDN